MEYYLICTNTRCRLLVNLREGPRMLRRSQLVIEECPKCGHPWSSSCPSCGRPLEVIQAGYLSLCLYCGGELRPDANVDTTIH
jgi:predicted amidophosphoribosyltransferase